MAAVQHAPKLAWSWVATLSPGYLLLYMGLAALAAPTLVLNAQQSWSTEQGQQGPIVLALGVWLLARAWPAVRSEARPSSVFLSAIAMLVSALVYVFGRVSDQFRIETYSLYALGVAVLYALLGARSVRKAWFPLTYLIFALPAPYTLTWLLTNHLRLWISETAVALCQIFGLTVVRDGLNIMVDQYELAIRDACSGMNSLISLSAIGLLYIHVRRATPWWYVAAMLGPIIGFAVLANFVRVMILIALTHFFGDAVAQSYLHEGAGLVTFLTALLAVIALDELLARFALRAPSVAQSDPLERAA